MGTTKWISVTDKKKPKDFTYVLVYCPEFSHSKVHIAEWNLMTKSFESETNGMISDYVTHWMKLPQLPNH